MNQQTADKHGFKINANDAKPIKVANNSRIRCAGSTKFRFTFSGRSIDIYALVSPDVHHPFYLGLEDQIKLGMLPSNYPNTLLPPPTVSSLTAPPPSHEDTIRSIQAIIDSFPDVFDISKGIRPMKGPPMSIRLRNDNVPNCSSCYLQRYCLFVVSCTTTVYGALSWPWEARVAPRWGWA